jgi:spore coat protein U-like protein
MNGQTPRRMMKEGTMTMRIEKVSSVALAIALSGATLLTAGAAHAASANANVNAAVAAPLAVTKNADLAFGDFVADASSCTLSVNAAGTRSVASGSCTLLSSTASAADFSVSGTGNRAISVNVPASVTLSDGGGNTMTVTTANNAPSNLTGGAANFQVYGDLAVGAGQIAGSYSGTLTVTVNY